MYTKTNICTYIVMFIEDGQHVFLEIHTYNQVCMAGFLKSSHLGL